MATKKGQISSGRPVAMVSGASRGIGAAIAQELAEAGYDLILTCSDTISDLKKIGKDLEKEYGVGCLCVKTDMSKWSEVSKLFESVPELDVLVNNAGISHVGLLSDMTPEQWDHVLGVNLGSAFYTCKCAIPLMLRKHSGRILNISSVWGNVGASLEVAYSASKGGILALTKGYAFTKALAKELAPSHIAVNAIACGVIDTSMNAVFTEEEMEELRKEIPADRIGTPREVAKLALHVLSSPDYMTGQIIGIDGGWI